MWGQKTSDALEFLYSLWTDVWWQCQCHFHSSWLAGSHLWPLLRSRPERDALVCKHRHTLGVMNLCVLFPHVHVCVCVCFLPGHWQLQGDGHLCLCFDRNYVLLLACPVRSEVAQRLSKILVTPSSNQLPLKKLNHPTGVFNCTEPFGYTYVSSWRSISSSVVLREIWPVPRIM